VSRLNSHVELLKKIQKRAVYVFLGVFFVIAIFIYSVYFQESSRKYLTVAFLDVGQGDSIFIEAPNGNQILIDGGPTASVVRQLSKYIPFYDRSINMIISTHSDLDHIGGFPEIFKRYKIGKYITSDKKDSADLYLELEKLNETEKADRIFLQSGDRIILDEKRNIYLEALWPKDSNSANDNNDTSVVVKLIYGKKSFLLTGDASTLVESEIISYLGDDLSKSILNSDILKIGHHGSKTSSSDQFVRYVSPEYSIISVGKDNKFGHPDKEVIDFLDQEKIKILETSIFGSIVFETDGESVWRKTN